MSKLVLQDLGKLYRVYPSPRQRLFELLTGRKRHHEHWALRGVDLEVAQGEAVGVIGNNGAGKSTLLKLVTGTLTPTSGKVDYQGRLTAILELGTGFHPDFTGHENLFYAGALMGVHKHEIAARYDQIVEFSELGEAIFQPLKTYSTGMVVRLAFSLVTMVDPEILIIDEALAVGDRNFQKKCLARMIEIQKSGTTILFCSHSMHHVMQFCDRAIWLENGNVMALGEVGEVVDQYVASSLEEKNLYAKPRNKEGDGHADLHCQVTEMLIEPETHITRGERLLIKLRFRVLREDSYVLGVALDQKETMTRMVAETSLENGLPAVRLTPGEYRVSMSVDTGLLREGQYIVYAGLLDESLLTIEHYLEREIDVIDSDEIRSPAMVRLDVEWDLEKSLLVKR
ncbi:MAG: ABC transporter ATP-binding protein [Candidatus Thiodiazotropha sp.]|nr:ABC transporter ATP-binding protein [Candidatus Thiodiazotropha taylori]MBT3057886.1 ABC transporter ATP-binding protein [Candidatus Thiodiazotropha sp. (ex Lucina pensylvanica)]